MVQLPFDKFRFLPAILIGLLALLFGLTICFFDGTGDTGDSVLHYLFAKYAPTHPALFFDHWAKPVYVLLASPFAQFGFAGIKVFNCLVVLFTIHFTYLSVKLLGLKNAALSILLMGFAPLYYILTFSGLTEPLFALFLALVIYLSLRNKLVSACLVLSFLPLVRSEGLILIGVFVCFLLIRKKLRLIPFLFVGSVVYSLAGYPVHHDLFWVFTKIPYAKLSSTYGSGSLFHYVNQLLYVVGIPIYILFCIGLVVVFVQLFRKKFELGNFTLIVLSFGGFFVAHTLFWYLGIFNSMGLNRVLLCVMPCIGIIALMGLNNLSTLFPFYRIGFYLQLLFLIYILVFPFTPNPASIDWKYDMQLSSEQVMIQKVGKSIAKIKGNRYPILCTHPYLSEALNLDHFDSSKRLNLNHENFKLLRKGSLIVWENWFAVLEENVGKEWLDEQPDLELFGEWKGKEEGPEHWFVVYRKK